MASKKRSSLGPLRNGEYAELAAQGLLMRKPASDDARKVSLRLTAKGLRVAKQIAGNHRGELERIGPQLTELLRHIASVGPGGESP